MASLDYLDTLVTLLILVHLVSLRRQVLLHISQHPFQIVDTLKRMRACAYPSQNSIRRVMTSQILKNSSVKCARKHLERHTTRWFHTRSEGSRPPGPRWQDSTEPLSETASIIKLDSGQVDRQRQPVLPSLNVTAAKSCGLVSTKWRPFSNSSSLQHFCSTFISSSPFINYNTQCAI